MPNVLLINKEYLILSYLAMSKSDASFLRASLWYGCTVVYTISSDVKIHTYMVVPTNTKLMPSYLNYKTQQCTYFLSIPKLSLNVKMYK